MLPSCGGGSGAAAIQAADGLPSTLARVTVLDDLLRNARRLVVTEMPAGMRPPVARPAYLPAARRLALLRTRGEAIGWANRFSEVIWEETRQSWPRVKRVACVWFDWYLEEGALVPGEAEFEELFLDYLLGYVPSNPSQRLRGSGQPLPHLDRERPELGRSRLQRRRDHRLLGALSTARAGASR